jgi:hypothetical protein
MRILPKIHASGCNEFITTLREANIPKRLLLPFDFGWSTTFFCHVQPRPCKPLRLATTTGLKHPKALVLTGGEARAGFLADIQIN